jgi:conjugal transfer pilus assembly protein TraV
MQLSLKKITVLCCLIGLTGCASLNSQFDCPVKPGIHCKRVDEINSMVDSGAISATQETPCRHCNPAMNGHTGSETTFSPENNAFPDFTPTALRTHEKILRIWVAPYEDTTGNYYGENVMYRVVTPPTWVGESSEVTLPGTTA